MEQLGRCGLITLIKNGTPRRIATRTDYSSPKFQAELLIVAANAGTPRR